MENGYRLELDPESVHTKTDTYTSLTDSYRIPLFTDQYEEQMDRVLQEKADQESILIEDVFTGSEFQENTDIMDALFLDMPVDYRNSSAGMSKDGQTEYGKWGVGILLLLLLLLFEIRGLRRRKRNYDDRNYNEG